MKCPACSYKFKNPSGIPGGKKSRRKLTPEQARAMNAKRWAKKDPMMSIQNPDNLTPEQIGTADGWRLLDADEIIHGPEIAGIHRMGWGGWEEMTWHRHYWKGSNPRYSYRTKLSREELRKARGLEEEPLATRVIAAAEKVVAGQDVELSSLRAQLDRVTAERDAAINERNFDPCISECRNGHHFRTTPNTPAKSEREWECPHCAVADRDRLTAELQAAQKHLFQTREDRDKAFRRCEDERKALCEVADQLRQAISERDAAQKALEEAGKQTAELVSRFARLGEMLGDPLGGDFCQIEEAVVAKIVEVEALLRTIGKDDVQEAVDWVEEAKQGFPDRASLLSQRDAALAAKEEAERLHYELLHEIANAYPGETRHQTALRIIRQASKPYPESQQGGSESL